MNRFQIEDIIEQDKHGIVFRARDGESGSSVALRRFFPFGQDGGGLEKDEAIAFGIASERLSEVSHVALRSVITGSVDPIDGIPYLVTEWVDGMPLRAVLGNENLDPALVIDVLRIALEVSIVLSHVLGEEAVWVETEVDSIIIGTRESGRGFTFWISPFKWLGAQFESRKLSSIVDLGEELTGWKKKSVSDQAGYGLGGWLKWLKNHPDARLGEALEMLAASTGNEPPLAEADLVEHATNPKELKIKQPSTKRALIFTAAVSLIVIGSALFYLHKTAKHPEIAADYSEQEISPVIQAPATETKPVPAKATTPRNATERANALAKKLSEEAAAKDKVPKTSAVASPQKPSAGTGEIFSPEDRDLWDNIKGGTPVKLRGTLRSVKFSSTGKSVYLNFSDPSDPKKLGGVAHKSSFTGDFRPQTFTPLVGKTLLVSGTCFKELTGRMYVEIRSADQVKPVE